MTSRTYETPARTPHAAGAELITYPDSLGGHLAALESVLRNELAGLFGAGIHLLPPFPSTADRGFAPTRYDQIDPAFGGWADLERIGRLAPLTLDVMVNHLSMHSPEFQDVIAAGRQSMWFDAFMTPDKIWSGGTPPADKLRRIHLRKPDHPFTTVRVGHRGEMTFWTTFAQAGRPSQQFDLDPAASITWSLYRRWFRELAGHGVRRVRLDAVGYLTKRAGTSCFMVEPEIWTLLDGLEGVAADHGLSVLPEVHAGRAGHLELSRRGHVSYDFALPGLVLHTLFTGSTGALREHLQVSPARQITMLDCHDGIPAHPDLDEVLEPAEIGAVVDRCVAQGANISPVIGDPAPARAHQINCTFRSAVGSDDAMVAACAIQLFAPGTPQVYYVGLLGGHDVEVPEGGDGRDVNRHNYSLDEVRAALRTELAQRQIDLITLRNRHPAFKGTWTVLPGGDHELAVIWHLGNSWCRLDIDVRTMEVVVSATAPDATVESRTLCGASA